MTFLRTSASCPPSNFGTPMRLGAACAAVGKSRPATRARQPKKTETGAFVVTRQHSSIRKDCFSRTPNRTRPIAVLALLAGLGCATGAPRVIGPRVIFDETSRFGRVLVIDEGRRRVMRFGSPSGSEQSAIDLDDPRAVPLEYVRYALLG